jgi:hypothetical protein
MPVRSRGWQDTLYSATLLKMKFGGFKLFTKCLYFVSAHSFKLRRIKRNETAAYFPYKENPPYAIMVFNSVVYRVYSSEAWHRHRPEANLFTSLPTMHFICMRPKKMQKKEANFCLRCSFFTTSRGLNKPSIPLPTSLTCVSKKALYSTVESYV